MHQLYQIEFTKARTELDLVCMPTQPQFFCFFLKCHHRGQQLGAGVRNFGSCLRIENRVSLKALVTIEMQKASGRLGVRGRINESE